jgi:hypothetical protein
LSSVRRHRRQIARQPKLNSRQLALLRRIGGGKDPVTSLEHELAVTVYALRNRRLVTTPRSGGPWTAEVTTAGIHYLAHGYYLGESPPEPAPPAQSRKTESPSIAAPAREPCITAEALMEKVIAKKGFLRLYARMDRLELEDWRNAAEEARWRGLVPKGYHLHSKIQRNDVVLELLVGPDPEDFRRAAEPVDIDVHERLGRPHLAVKALRDRQAPAVSKASRNRALRLLDALARAAKDRGIAVTAGAEAGAPHLVFQLADFEDGATMREELDSVPHVATAAELREAERSPWVRIPDSDRVPSGRLRIELSQTPRDGRWYWADRKRWSLDERLDEIVIEFEFRAATERAKEAVIQAVLDRRRQTWEARIKEAGVDFAQACRRDIVNDQINSWNKSELLRLWATAVEEAWRSRTVGQSGETLQWVQWIRAEADRIDPLAQIPGWPTIRSPEPDDLAPFLKGLSPRGPDLSRPWVR